MDIRSKVIISGKIVIVVGLPEWWRCISDRFEGKPLRKLFSQGAVDLHQSYRTAINGTLHVSWSGVIIVYCSQYQKSDAEQIKSWIHEYHPITPKVELLSIPISSEELKAAAL